jgi:hypothetical protein
MINHGKLNYNLEDGSLTATAAVINSDSST